MEPCSSIKLQSAEDEITLTGGLEEETWVNEGGVNIFDAIMDAPLEERQLWLTSRSLGLRYRSFPESTMTPLDMNYNEAVVQDEFYDGTGTMVWLAARALAWSLDQDIHELYSQCLLSKNHPRVLGSPTRPRPVWCELGCGTGLAGLAALVRATVENDSKQAPLVAFTDNDQESLVNCKSNCILNNLPEDSYSHHRLSWGIPETYPPDLVGSADVVLATDVLYDMKMVRPLFQTAVSLLREPYSNHGLHSACEDSNDTGGMMILSHVPRFCLPRNHDGEVPADCPPCESSPTVTTKQHPYIELEDHLVVEAHLAGLHIVDKFRPHETLRLISRSITGRGPEASFVSPTDTLHAADLERLKQAHSIIYVLQRREHNDTS